MLLAPALRLPEAFGHQPAPQGIGRNLQAAFGQLLGSEGGAEVVQVLAVDLQRPAAELGILAVVGGLAAQAVDQSPIAPLLQALHQAAHMANGEAQQPRGLHLGALPIQNRVQDAQAIGTLSEAKIYIDDTPSIGVLEMRAKCRRLAAEHGLHLVIIDYVQLMQGRGKFENRTLELGSISRSLKGLAKELNVPILALSQLSRQVENRDDKRPQLADLRESGSIEQDADVVLFIYREEYYLGRKEPRPGTPDHVTWQDEMNRVTGIAEVIIGKQRHGPTGTVPLQFEASLTKFSNLATADYLPEQFQ